MAAEAYIARLGERGIEYVFANAGTDFAPIVEALSHTKRTAKVPRFMMVPHENVAMAMAHGYYRIAGKPAAVMVHVTVGTANAINGIINAARDNIPVLLAAGRTPLTETGSIASRNRPIHWGQEAFDQGGMLREYVKWDYELRGGQPVGAVVDRALDIAMSEPRGPVYLTLPREVLSAPVDRCPPRHRAPARRAGAGTGARRDRGGGGAHRQGRVPADRHLEQSGAWRRRSARSRRSPTSFAIAGGAGGGARHEPADRSSHASRPRRRRVPAEGRRGDRDRQRRCRGCRATIQPRKDAKVIHISADPLETRYPFRELEADLWSTRHLARGHDHAARDAGRGDEGQEDRDRKPAQGAGGDARGDRRQAPQADRDA